MKDFPGFNRLIIVAYRLPFKFIKHKNSYKAVQNAGGLVSAILALSEKYQKNQKGNKMKKKILWAGTGENIPEGIPSDTLSNNDFELINVKISSKLNELYYGGFCNDLIWPLFHYFSSYSVFKSNYYDAYKEANQKFCNEIIQFIKPGDFVWIHDYQLMMLPDMIRKKKPEATIGFFLHIPFPSFEIFRLMPKPWREDLINGLLGADLIGFHTHDYAQHFIKSVKRTTGYECRQNIIYTNDRLVKADAFPIGIDYDKFHDTIQTKSVQAEMNRIRKSIADLKLIFSVDRLDYSKGLISRLTGYETFLEKYPEWRSKVVFNMVVVPSRDQIEQYKDMKTEIESMVGRINGKYSTLAWRPIVYQYKSLSFSELIALYNASEVGLITPLRDGMNLVAKEFIASQGEDKGVLILSEMAGAAAELTEALLINPADNNEIASSINSALTMKPEDRKGRIVRMQARISSYNVFTWALDFFDQTYHAKKQQDKMSVKYINQKIVSKIKSDYKGSKKRLFFLDYDGTLVNFTRYPELAVIDKGTLALINDLAQDTSNYIVIISGRSTNFLDQQFNGIQVSMVAEHGYFIKHAGKKWISTVNSDAQWKESVIPIMQEYVNRCNGTFIEEKTGSLAWHYRNADSDFAQLRLHELRDDLAEIIRYKTDFEILEGHKVLEVKSGRYDKGQAAVQMISENTDFILAAGDDNTDEYLFKAMPENAYSIRVGLRPSFAKYNVANTSQMVSLLKEICGT